MGSICVLFGFLFGFELGSAVGFDDFFGVGLSCFLVVFYVGSMWVLVGFYVEFIWLRCWILCECYVGFYVGFCLCSMHAISCVLFSCFILGFMFGLVCVLVGFFMWVIVGFFWGFDVGFLFVFFMWLLFGVYFVSMWFYLDFVLDYVLVLFGF